MSDQPDIKRVAMFDFKRSMRNLLLYGVDPLLSEIRDAHDRTVRTPSEHERLEDAWMQREVGE